MDFQIPQFVEHEAKIVGPFTFKQFTFVGVAGGLCLILYFMVPRALFFVIAIFLAGLSLSLAFMQVGGRSLGTYFKNSVVYFIKPKIYLWKQKEIMISTKTIQTEKAEREEIKAEEAKGATLKIAERSRLRELSSKVETSKEEER